MTGKLTQKLENGLVKYICYILIFYCVLIRCYFYIDHKDLWLDECLIANAIYETPWSDLIFGRFPNVQSCPLVFAMIAKLLSHVTNYSPYVLYFFPTVAGILITFIIYHFSVKLYGYLFAACSLAIYSILYMPLYYSSEFKPYIFDFLFTIVLFGNLFLDIRKEQAFKIFLSKKYPLLFTTAWLCSSSSIICSAAIGITIFIYLYRIRKFILKDLILKLVRSYYLFAIFSIFYYFLFLRQGASDVMYTGWKPGFIPLAISAIPEWTNQILKPVYYELTTTIYYNNLSIVLSNILFWNAIIGFISMLYEKKYESISFIVLFIIVFILAIKIYPIGLPYDMRNARLVCYILPIFVFCTAQGCCTVINFCCKLQYRYQFFILVLIFTICFFGIIKSGIYYLMNRIYDDQSFQKFQLISDNYNPNSDLIVIDGGTVHTFKYWKIVNSKMNNLPFIYIPATELIKPHNDLMKIIGKSNYQSKKRIYFLFVRDPRAVDNVKRYFEERKWPIREPGLAGTELLIIDILS